MDICNNANGANITYQMRYKHNPLIIRLRIKLYALNIIIVVELHSSKFKDTTELNNTIVKRDHDLVYLIILLRTIYIYIYLHFQATINTFVTCKTRRKNKVKWLNVTHGSNTELNLHGLLHIYKVLKLKLYMLHSIIVKF